MTDLSERQEEQTKKRRETTSDLRRFHLFSMLWFSLRSGRSKWSNFWEERKVDSKGAGMLLSLMKVLLFIPTQWKRVHPACAIWCNSTQIILLHWKEILFSSRHLWPGSLDRLTRVKSAKSKKCSDLHPAVWFNLLSGRNPFIPIYQQRGLDELQWRAL